MKQDQQTIKVAHTEITVIESDNQQWVAIKPICDALGLDLSTQRNKLKNDSDYNLGHKPVVAADGKVRQMDCLLATQVNFWLGSISSAKIKESAREKLSIFRKDLMNAVHKYTQTGVAINANEVQHNPHKVMRAFAEQLTEALDEIDRQERVIQEQRDAGSLNVYSGMLSTAQYETLRSITYRYGFSKSFGKMCVRYCNDNDIEYGLAADGSHCKDIKAYPLEVLDIVYNELTSEPEYSANAALDLLTNPCFDW